MTTPWTETYKNTCVLLDIDENLVPSTYRILTPQQQGTLMRLHDVLDGGIAFVTNSDMRSVDQTTFMPGFPCVSEHGAIFRLTMDGTPTNTSPAFPIEIVHNNIKSELICAQIKTTESSHDILAQNGNPPAVILEEKQAGIAIVFGEHAALREPLARIAQRTLDQFNDRNTHFVDDRGRDAIEIKPVGFAKEKSLDTIMSHDNFKGRHPIVMGDSGPDDLLARDAFNKYGGYGHFRGDSIPKRDYEGKRHPTYQDVWNRLDNLAHKFTLQKSMDSGRVITIQGPVKLHGPTVR